MHVERKADGPGLRPVLANTETIMNEQENIFEKLSEYLDGELAPEQAAQLERAVAEDPELAATLAQLRAVKEQTRALPRIKTSEDFVSRVMASAERGRLMKSQEAGTGRSRKREWVGHMVGAAVAIIALGVIASVLVSIYSVSNINSAPVADSPESQGDSYASSELARSEDQAGLPAYDGLGLAKGYVVQMDVASKPGPDVDIVVATHDLAALRKDLEGTLLANGILPVEDATRQRAGATEPSSNSYMIARADDDQLVYEVTVEPEQASELAAALDKFSISNSDKVKQSEIALVGGGGMSGRGLRKQTPIPGMVGDKPASRSEMNIENRFAPPTTQLAVAAPASPPGELENPKRKLNDQEELLRSNFKSDKSFAPAKIQEQQSASTTAGCATLPGQNNVLRQSNRLQITLQYIGPAVQAAPASQPAATSQTTAPAQ